MFLNLLTVLLIYLGDGISGTWSCTFPRSIQKIFSGFLSSSHTFDIRIFHSNQRLITCFSFAILQGCNDLESLMITTNGKHDALFLYLD